MTKNNGADGALYFLPLGGSDEIGMNLYLYGIDGKWLMVDCGISFGDDTTPGVEIILPDPTFIEERRRDLVGLVLTHAHEDHFGAIPYLWPRLRCPVYATPFTAALLRLKLRDSGLQETVPIIEVPLDGDLSLGPFDLSFVRVTHSIPEPNALIIRTRHGTVVHSGDWKLDPTPLVGRPTDGDRLHRVGEEGVLALICDSTNAMVPGASGSEAMVRDELTRLIPTLPQRVAVTCFSTNVVRLASIAHAAHVNGRHCALIGRSLWRVHEAATATGYLKPAEPFISETDAGYLPPDRVVLVCTGSQGEPRSALARISADEHPHIVLESGDTVIFSARDIPGNEKAIGRVQNALVRMGVRLITPDDAPIHVSGHPAQDELIQMYQWLRPKVAVPVHGESRHLAAHAALALSCQVPQALVPEDGALIRLAPGRAEIVDHVQAGRIGVDGTRMVPITGSAMRTRTRLIHNGAAVITLVMDEAGALVAEPKVSLLGLENGEDPGEEADALAEEVRFAIEDLPRPRRRDDDSVREVARTTLRRAMRERAGKKPLTDVHLVRV